MPRKLIDTSVPLENVDAGRPGCVALHPGYDVCGHAMRYAASGAG
jgi:hypothetical protein